MDFSSINGVATCKCDAHMLPVRRVSAHASYRYLTDIKAELTVLFIKNRSCKP